ncbi:Actin-binding protein anillin [Oryzias melastigma]|uniref:Actin-binding protein anillin n=1 Tax=Oryzias melastigma TaxID=30732 RepID=A0A834C311_ORYME|nr:Actin-binding protein anillin [Oryzias melastigma]
METDEENCAANLKRQREPLSDAEENTNFAAESNEGQKRPRLESAGQENRSPKPSSSGRLAELQAKPDTPIVPSVRSRVQLFSQRQEGGAAGAMRCLSDPGSQGPSFIHHDRSVRQHLLADGEFTQRMERFKAPALQATPTKTPSPAGSDQRSCSSLVSDIQHKLQSTTTPSSKQASRIRQERELELNQLPFNPIRENALLKRSSSDSSLTQQAARTPPGSSLLAPSFKRRVVWPPTQSWDVQGDADVTDGSFVEASTSDAAKPSNMTDFELSSHDETNTAEMIDQMFEEVLEYAGRVEKETHGDAEDCDSGADPCSESRVETEEKNDDVQAAEEEDELLNFPPTGILSPLSKSVEAVVTPLRLGAESNPSSLLLSPEETSTPTESAPLYSVDAYRTQRQSKLPAIQSVTPALQRRAAETSKPQPAANTKEEIAALNEEAGKLQTVINQTLQALSCCTDEDHGRGSLEEAEAEKLLLVSSEKRSALLAEVARLRQERSSVSEEAAKEDSDYISQQPCRGTVHITNIQLPLKVEFVCSSQSRAGRPSHYFFVLIHSGPYNIVATPLATAADAHNGDTISFPTSVTLKDIRSSFEIDVEVYSLSCSSGTISNSTTDRANTKSRVTPRKLLNTITRSSNTLSGAAPINLGARRSSSFCLVGSHKITLASLGQSKFPLDKMKFEGKVRKLLGDEFQQKVPFLSPLEGSIYMRLRSESHSSIHHHGFLTMFELISGFGSWHRRYFVLEGCSLSYWNSPTDRENKAAEGVISLSGAPSRCVRPVKRDSCARPFTFELVSSMSKQEESSQEIMSKCWFSADTREERLDWMEKLNQALLDFQTWNQSQSGSHPSSSCSTGNLRESML